MLSCTGTDTRSGTTVSARKADNTWKRVAFEAKQTLNVKAATPGKTIQYRRQ